MGQGQGQGQFLEDSNTIDQTPLFEQEPPCVGDTVIFLNLLVVWG